MLGGIIAAATSAIGSQIKGIEARDAEERAYTKQKELMDKQYALNDKMAEANQQRAKYMWDYTNFENQKQHLLNANLSPGLFYGGSGAGGSTTSGGQGSGVGLGMETGVGYGIQEKALGLQLASMASQVALNQSQANKNNAEANKIKGADTKLTESETRLNNAMEKLTNMKENTEAANYNLALQEQSKVFEEARAMGLQNDITEATKQTQIDTVIQNYYLNSLTAFEKIAGIELKGKEAAYISKQIEWYSYEAITKRMSAEAMQSMAKSAAERVKNDFEIAGKKLDQEQEKILQNWIFESVKSLCTVAETAGDIISMFRKPIQKVGEKVFEEIFDAKGKSKGFKEVFKDFKMK
jgi:hypothetical protein